MAITVGTIATYNVNSYTNLHTISSFSCSGTNSYLIVSSYNRNPGVEVTGITANGNAMELIGETIGANVVAVQVWGYAINNSSFSITCSTPSYKQQGMIATPIFGVDQTTPYGSTSAGSGFSTAPSAVIDVATNDLIFLGLSSQNGRTVTAPSGVSVTTLTSFDQLSGDIGQCWAGWAPGQGFTEAYDFTLNSNDNWRVLLVEIYEASAPPAGNTTDFFAMM